MRQIKLLEEDARLINQLMQVLSVDDPAHPEDLRHAVIRWVIGILVRVKWL